MNRCQESVLIYLGLSLTIRRVNLHDKNNRALGLIVPIRSDELMVIELDYLHHYERIMCLPNAHV